MGLRQLFENRSGRVIAIFRVALATVFFVALMVEPVTAPSALWRGQALIGAYLILSIAVVPLVWQDWWRDHKLALPLLVLDVLIFLGAVFITEGSDADFTSPFLSIFALTVLSATLRWDWHVAARTGAVVIILFVVTGLIVHAAAFPLDLYRFSRRALYMAALLLVLIWFGMQRSEPKVPALSLRAEGPDDEPLLWQALDYARALANAQIGVIGWSAAEEPWIQWRSIGLSGRHAMRNGPEGADDIGIEQVHLFDRDRRCKLSLDRDGRPRAERLRSPLAAADWGGLQEGLALPFSGMSGRGVILLGAIPGPGPDFLSLGTAIAREVGTAFDRLAIARLERETLVSRTRSAVARDLHDSVAQSLAGACFRLEALRRAIASDRPDGDQAGSEIVSVRDALRREQSHVRTLIESLRHAAPSLDFRDLRADLDAALADAGAHWGLAAALDAPGPVDVPGWVSHEVQQLVREAVANAARHGAATRISVRLTPSGGVISLEINDNGSGFDVAIPGRQPWSISERVTALGGTLRVESGTAGTELAIILPQPGIRGT